MIPILAKLAEFALLAGFIGFGLSVYVQWKTLSNEQKKGYRSYLVAAIVFIVFAVAIQILVLPFTFSHL
jgi:hypothetical protein